MAPRKNCSDCGAPMIVMAIPTKCPGLTLTGWFCNSCQCNLQITGAGVARNAAAHH